MISIISCLPSWAFRCLPVRLARKWVNALRDPLPANALNNTACNLIQRQLLVDVSVIHNCDARTGIQRVVRALLLQLLQTPPAGCVVRPVFAARSHGYRYASRECIEVIDAGVETEGIEDKPVQVQPGDTFLGLDLVAHLLYRHQAQILGWKRSGVKVHVVVYDLLPLQHPDWFNSKTTRNFARWFGWMAVYADSAVCISQTVQMELVARLNASFGLPINALPASTIVLGADIQASAPSGGLPAEAKFLLARMRNTFSVLMVGTLEPRKGYEQALTAFELLWQHPNHIPMLVIVGSPGWKTEALQQKIRTHRQLNKRLFWLEDVSDEFLTRLYNTCSGVLAASRAEGFGLPLIEAAMHGKPVLARDIPVFKELQTAGLTFFNTSTPQGLATAITHWREANLTQDTGRTQPQFPTWQLSAAQLVSALNLGREEAPSPKLKTDDVNTSTSKSMPSVA